jgi:tRNA C32,U32 (ribose-2'-O)-methylase TrmJ
MFQHMEKVLIQIGFLSKANPEHIMQSIRRLLSKAELTERDVQIVRGIMSQMEWFASKGNRLPPEDVKKP